MDIQINESKLFKTIYRYIDGSYDVDKIDFFNPTTFDEDKEEDTENPYIIEFFDEEYFGDYDENGLLFVYIVKEYYKDEPSSQSFRNQTPILIVNNLKEFPELFGEYWKEPLKKWFEDNFNLPVKTIVTD
jgi:hypothetical protein